MVMNEMHLSVFHSVSYRASLKALEKQCLRGSLCFQLVVLGSSKRFYDIQLHDLTDFYVERATAPHYNK